MESEKYISAGYCQISKLLRSAKEQQNCQCLDQKSGRRWFVVNLLQKRSIGTSFWKVNAFSN